MKKLQILIISTMICVTPVMSAEWELTPETKVKLTTETTAGINNEMENDGYIVGESGFSVSHEISDGVDITFEDNVVYEQYHVDELEPNNVYENSMSLGVKTENIKSTIHYGKLGKKKGASYAHVNKLDGMKSNMSKYNEDYNSASLLNEVYGVKFGYSVKDLDNEDKEWSAGTAYEVNGLTVGLGYDNEAGGQSKTIGASAEYKHTIGDVKNVYSITYIRQPNKDTSSIGLAVESELNKDLTVVGKSAFNDLGDGERSHYVGGEAEYKNFGFEAGVTHEGDVNEYELSAEYEDDTFAAEADIEFTAEGNSNSGIGAQYKLNVIAPEGTTLFTGYSYERGEEEETGAYVAAEFGVSKEFTVGVSHSETHESGPNDFMKGSSLYVRAKF